jgi:hypothetical protein
MLAVKSIINSNLVGCSAGIVCEPSKFSRLRSANLAYFVALIAHFTRTFAIGAVDAGTSAPCRLSEVAKENKVVDSTSKFPFAYPGPVKTSKRVGLMGEFLLVATASGCPH